MCLHVDMWIWDMSEKPERRIKIMRLVSTEVEQPEVPGQLQV